MSKGKQKPRLKKVQSNTEWLDKVINQLTNKELTN